MYCTPISDNVDEHNMKIIYKPKAFLIQKYLLKRNLQWTSEKGCLQYQGELHEEEWANITTEKMQKLLRGCTKKCKQHVARRVIKRIFKSHPDMELQSLQIVLLCYWISFPLTHKSINIIFILFLCIIQTFVQSINSRHLNAHKYATGCHSMWYLYEVLLRTKAKAITVQICSIRQQTNQGT